MKRPAVRSSDTKLEATPPARSVSSTSRSISHVSSQPTAERSASAISVGSDQANNAANNSGAVYVFVRNGAIWSQQTYIKASNTDSGDSFGFKLALSGDGETLAVGARLEDSNATGIGGDQIYNATGQSGAVYLFVRSGATWSQQAYIKASNTDGNDFFGGSVALSSNGDILAVGAQNESSNATGISGDQANNAASASGAVYLF